MDIKSLTIAMDMPFNAIKLRVNISIFWHKAKSRKQKSYLHPVIPCGKWTTENDKIRFLNGIITDWSIIWSVNQPYNQKINFSNL